MLQRDWFDAGSAVFEGLTEDPASYPPLNDKYFNKNIFRKSVKKSC